MMEIPKKRYQSPALTVVEFKMERGYATSDPIKEWTGISIEQELYYLNNSGDAQNITGNYTASIFTDGGNITGSGYGYDDGTWF